MTNARSLQGLMKWLTRAEWCDRFAEVYDWHLLPACRRTGVDAEEVVAILGENWFTTTVWGCAFEDFLTREGADGSNVVDDYLKRRGWKESASARAYMSALRRSVMSLYEVSDIVRDTSFQAQPRADEEPIKKILPILHARVGCLCAWNLWVARRPAMQKAAVNAGCSLLD